MISRDQLIKSFINKDSSILDALKAINGSGTQLALIIDENKVLKGVINDGDIRRSLLKGYKLSDSIKDIFNKNFHKITENQLGKEAKEKMFSIGLNAIPVINKEKQPIDILTYTNFSESKKLKNPLVIMAGGIGSRLLPYTKNCPKPMLPLNGNKPILLEIIEQAKLNGFESIYLSVNYLKEQIMDYFKDGSEFGVNIEYLVERKPLGTGGSLSLLPKNNQLPVLVINGDIITKFNLKYLLDFHLSLNSNATMAVIEHETKLPFGVVKTNGTILNSFEEKPVISHLINAGLYVIDQDLINKLVNEDTQIDMPELFWEAKHKNFNVNVCPIVEYWIDIGRPDALKKAQHQGNIDFTTNKN